MKGQILFLMLALPASWMLTGAVRRYAIRAAMLDYPGPRSSHTVPTPRGGGLAIAVVVLSGLALAATLRWIPEPVAFAMIGGGIPIAVIGWLDDRRGTAPGTRLTVQAVAGAWALWWLGVPPPLQAGSWPFLALGALVAVLGIVWATNCFNFMDGIDGLAGGEATTVGLAGALVLLAAGHRQLALVSLLIGTASAGFLMWNWSPARIFMGDVGSGLLGFLFAALAVASATAGALPLVAWIILLGVFAFDATATIVLRAWRGEPWYQPHRSHAYQLAVQSGWSHSRVVATVLLMDVCLAGTVWQGMRYPDLWPALTVAAIAVVAAVYWWVQRAWAARLGAKRPT